MNKTFIECESSAQNDISKEGSAGAGLEHRVECMRTFRWHFRGVSNLSHPSARNCIYEKSTQGIALSPSRFEIK